MNKHISGSKNASSSLKLNWKSTFNAKGSAEASAKNSPDKHDVNAGAADKSESSLLKVSQHLEEPLGNISREKTPNSRQDEQNDDMQHLNLLSSARGKQNANTNSASYRESVAQNRKSVDKLLTKKIDDSPLNRSRSGSVSDLASPKSAPLKKPLKALAGTTSNSSSPGMPSKMQDIVQQALAQSKAQGKAKAPSVMNTSAVAGGNDGLLNVSLRPSTGLGTAASVAFARDFTSNKAKVSNVKVVARIRPMNQMEKDLQANGVGHECVIFPSENSCAIMPENQIFTLDRFFRPDCTQAAIYDFIGKETIEDVLNGYNGTVFAYGQTGSGKTHTMYGSMHDPELKGLIPRSVQHIFEYINSMEEEVDISIKCSMLEIYKENLYDLLAGDKMVGDKTKEELKIKENPRRGIYVEGLTEEDVGSPEELMELLEIGDKQRTVASTRMNNYSSRSHSLFIMEIIQKFTNEAEKRGRLNLVDLAGSEKVGKTGATGETLEEAKKINLSLSCLGFVIHALTSGYEHIPYRDSKLTRILQESLGGNYKTTLIVAASPYSSNKEETITTLKFAARAKTIKNNVKMNIQNSPEALMAVIEGLKIELEECKIELAKFKEGGIPLTLTMSGSGHDIFQRNWSKFKATGKEGEGMGNESPLRAGHFIHPGHFIEQSRLYEDLQRQVKLDTFDPQATMEKIKQEYAQNKTELELQEAHNAGLSKIINTSLEFFKGNVNQAISLKIEEAKSLYQKKDYNSYAYYKTNLELLAINESLTAQIVHLKKDLENAQRDISDKDTKIREQEEEIVTMKNQLLENEKKINVLTQQNDLYELKVLTKTDNLDIQRTTIEVLEKQINAMSEALAHDDQEVQRLLSEKSRLVNAKFLELMTDDLRFREIKLPDYFKHSYNFNYEPFYDQVPKTTFLNPNYNANQSSSPIKGTNGEDGQGLVEGKQIEKDHEASVLEDDKIPDEKGSILDKNSRNSQSERVSQLEQGKKSSFSQRESFITGLDLENAFNNAENNLKECIEIPHAVQAALNKLSNGGLLRDALEEQNNMSAEFIIYVLKQQLFQAFIINQHLERTISALEWKQVIEYGKAKIKSYYTKMQERHILNLEKVLDKARVSHEQLRKRAEDVELESIKLRETILMAGPSAIEGYKSPNPKIGSRARILRTIKHDGRKTTRWTGQTPSTFSEVNIGGSAQTAKSYSLLRKNSEKGGSQKFSETDDFADETPRREVRVNFGPQVSGLKQQFTFKEADSAATFIREIDAELKNSTQDPSSLEEAKEMISLRNSVIAKMKNYIANSLSNNNEELTGAQKSYLEYLKHENDRLENKLLLIQTELGVEKTRSEQIKEAFNEQKRQMAKLSDLNRELEIASRNALKKENESWQKINDEIKAAHAKEMMRKQEEATKLHDFLAGWVFRYMELQKAQDIIPSHAEKSLYEVFKRREIPSKQLLEKALNCASTKTSPRGVESHHHARNKSIGGKPDKSQYSSVSQSIFDPKSKRPSRDFTSIVKYP